MHFFCCYFISVRHVSHYFGSPSNVQLSLADAGLMARRGYQETVEAAGEVAAKIKTKGFMDALATFAMKKVTFDERAAWNARLTSPVIPVQILAQCRNLPSRATRHANAFCVIWEVPSGYTGCDTKTNNNNNNNTDEDHRQATTTGRPCRLPRKQEREIGRSEVVHNSQNPIFTQAITVEYRFEADQWFLIRVYDQDLGYTQDLKEHDYIGGFAFQMGELMGRPSHKQITSLGDDNEDTNESAQATLLILKARESQAAKTFLEFRISAKGLQTVDSVLSTTDPYYMLERWSEEEEEWYAVWKSEVVFHDHNPAGGAATLSLLAVCGGNLAEDLRVTFWESHRNIQDEFLGYAKTSVRDLVETPEDGKRLPIKNWKKVFFGAARKLQQIGEMQILRASLIEENTFLQYLYGGCEIKMLLAVDCGAAIDHADRNRASHFVHGKWMNHYQAVIDKIGCIMESYSRSHPFQVIGYNATADIDQTQNFFKMGGDILGKVGLLKTYDKYFLRGNRFMDRSHDSYLAPLITETIFESIQATKLQHCYSVLFVLTSGHVTDLQETVDALLRAATDAPLSVVFIGCEEYDLEGLKGYYSKTKVQRSISGIRLSRDNTSFASFKDCGGDPIRVATEALKDLPEQIVQRFYQEGIDPKPAPKTDPATLKNIHKDRSKNHRKKDRGGKQSKSPERSRRRTPNSRSPNRRKHHS